MGDPAGIGPDISLYAWLKRTESAVPPFYLIADPDLLEDRASLLGLNAPITIISTARDTYNAFSSALPVLKHPIGSRVRAGSPELTAVPAIVGAIERGVRHVMAGDAAALVTNPISKSVLYEGGFGYPGHTEFLGVLAGVENVPAVNPVMMLATRELRVVPVTIHIPLKDVPPAISVEMIVQTAQTAIAGLKRYCGCEAPRLAVAGLNPHAGENGTMGREEIDIIAPAIMELQAAGFSVSGPHSADTLFHPAARETYDAALAMYHDQALIPLKTIGFHEGVNVTLGLPFIRTSPDHGVAFDIAGTGHANPQSLIEALRLAQIMFENSMAVDHDA